MSLCSKLFIDLLDTINDANFKLVKEMTNRDVTYNESCTKPSLTYTTFYLNLYENFNHVIDEFIIKSGKCAKLSNIISNSGRLQYSVPMDNQKIRTNDGTTMIHETKFNFKLSTNVLESLNQFVDLMVNNCKCQLADIYSIYTVDDADINKFNEFINNLINIKEHKKNIVNEIITNLISIYNLSDKTIEGQVNNLIPDDMGSLKPFFVTLITKYYDDIHPIIWTNILKQLIINFNIKGISNKNDIYKYVSRTILLNSGPFILKILQMIRPLLAPNIVDKYNINKLTYPVLTFEEVNLILNKTIKNFSDYKIKFHKSASVGHICGIYKSDNPNDLFIIKIIKPLSIAQSCWEYDLLHDLFAKGTCEHQFVLNMLKSNRNEMNVNNEINNIHMGHKHYKSTYHEIFKININNTLSTIEVKNNIMTYDAWFVFAMTLAPGLSLSDIIDDVNYEPLLRLDTHFRSVLHRCFDILVFKFFSNIILNGYYHADMHAGNIFFSYEKSQITLIDFGSVGIIDIYDNKPSTKILLEIIILSIFYDYDEILNKLTTYINSVCTEHIIDMKGVDYLNFKNLLHEHHIKNIHDYDEENKKQVLYETKIFGSKRINEENISHNDKMIVLSNIDDSTDSNVITFVEILELIFKFYANNNVNIALKFSELFELQKAYILLQGVLRKVNYNPYRENIVMQRAIKNMKNLSKIYHIRTVFNIVNIYLNSRQKFKKLLREIK
jgi:hypothetical protein